MASDSNHSHLGMIAHDIVFQGGYIWVHIGIDFRPQQEIKPKLG
jgi:hypothetical protein